MTSPQKTAPPLNLPSSNESICSSISNLPVPTGSMASSFTCNSDETPSVFPSTLSRTTPGTSSIRKKLGGSSTSSFSIEYAGLDEAGPSTSSYRNAAISSEPSKSSCILEPMGSGRFKSSSSKKNWGPSFTTSYSEVFSCTAPSTLSFSNTLHLGVPSKSSNSNASFLAEPLTSYSSNESVCAGQSTSSFLNASVLSGSTIQYNSSMCSDELISRGNLYQNAASFHYNNNDGTGMQMAHTLCPIPVQMSSLSNDDEVNCENHTEPIALCCMTCTELICRRCCSDFHKDHTYYTLEHNIDSQVLEDIKSIFQISKEKSKSIEKTVAKAKALANAYDEQTNEIISNIRNTVQHIIKFTYNHQINLIDKIKSIKRQKIYVLMEHASMLTEGLVRLLCTNELMVNSMWTQEIVAINEWAKEEIQSIATPPFQRMNQQTFIFTPPDPQSAYEISRRSVIQRVFANEMHAPPLGNVLLVPNLACPVQNAVPGPSNSLITRTGVSVSLSLLSRYLGRGIGKAIPGYDRPISVVVPDVESISPLLSFGEEGPEIGQLIRSWGLCVDKNGQYYVADRRNNRIQIFNNNGEFVRTFGSKGKGPGELHLPVGITTDLFDRIIVVDKDNHRVQIFSNEGNFVITFGSQGSGQGQFNYPWDVAVNTLGHIVVTDTRNYRIQMFTSDGDYITQFSFVKDNVHECYPRGICFTITGNVVVSDFENGRVFVLNSDISKIINYIQIQNQTFYRPSGLICDDNGNMVVVDTKNFRLVIINSANNTQQYINLQNSVPKLRPCNVALTRDGNLAVMFETLPVPSRQVTDTQNVCKLYIKVY